MRQDDFFNTVELKGEPLHKARKEARQQENMILAYFRSRPTAALTPEDLLAIMSPNTPLTSVRRAITNLTAKGFLRKLPLTDVFHIGKYGKPVHSWKLSTTTQETRQ